MDKSEAIKATRNGAIAACISAAISLGVVLFAIQTDAEGKFALFNDPANFIDIVLLLVCALGMYKKSRVASVLIFIYFIASKVIISIETQSYSGIGLALIFIYYYGKSVQGSFVYHKLEKEENPDYKATGKLAYVIGVPVILIVVTVITLALMSTTGVIPSTRVQTGNEIMANDLSTLRSHGIIDVNENIEFFYSQGFSSVLESGNILTKDRVILYLTDEEEELTVYELPLIDVVSVELESQGDSFNDSVYKVHTEDPERWIKLFLSVEQKGDQKFVKALRDRIIE